MHSYPLNELQELQELQELNDFCIIMKCLTLHFLAVTQALHSVISFTHTLKSSPFGLRIYKCFSETGYGII